MRESSRMRQRCSYAKGGSSIILRTPEKLQGPQEVRAEVWVLPRR